MFKDLIKMDLLPHIWCPGCGIGPIMIQLAMVLDELGLNHTNTILVSGIGCTGRMTGYMQFDAVYTLHGRTLPVAEAIKTVQPDKNVIVVSGDGDLTSIGGNHLLHTARRGPKLTVLCNNNEVYALTGGQLAPTTPKGQRTITTPGGSPFDPVNIQGIMKTGSTYFYAKTTIYHQNHLRKCIKEALDWPGFAFIDCTSDCIENNGRRLGFKTAYEMLAWYRKVYHRAPDEAKTLGPYEIGIIKKVQEVTNG